MSADIPLNNIRIKEFRIDEWPDFNLDLGLEGEVAFGLDNIRLGITELPPLHLGVTELPPLSIGVTELPDLNANLAVTQLPRLELTTDNTLKSDNILKSDNKVDLEVGVAVRELPRIDLQLGFRPMRFHLPLNYRFCLTLFGFRIFELHSCGEGLLIAEDNEPEPADAGHRNL